jgi:hypothetical protein
MSRQTAVHLVILAMLSYAVHAQTFRGQLTGTVADSTGAVIPNVEVIVTNLATGVSQKVTSNERGIYLVTNIEPGQHRVTAMLTGFKTFVQEPITVPVGGSLTMDVALQVGEMAERVTVTGEAPLLESETASFGQVVSAKTIRDMPLNTRNPMMLVTLTPGVVTSGFFSKDGIGAGNIEQGRDQYAADFQIGGGRPLHNEILLDGAPNTSVDRGYMAYSPPVDSTQEFKVELNPFSAEYDRTTGGVVNLVTKGGTNEFHGTAYEFYRTSKLDANDFFFNRAGRTDKPSWHRNQFGFNLGGPIRKNRTFFFGNYEGLRQAVPFTFLSTVPTPLQRQGNFSNTRTAAGQLIVIYDPLTLQTSPAGALSRSAFPGNLIPAPRWDRAGAAVMNAYPQPNVPGNPVTNAQNFFSSDSGTDVMNNYGVRVDHTFGQSNRIFGRFSHRKDARTAANRYGKGHPAINDGGTTDPSYNITVSDIHMFSPTLTGELRASFARHHTMEISPSFGFDLATLNFPQNYVAIARPFFPKVSTADLTGTGRDRYYSQVRDTVSIQGNATKLAGRHSLKTGFDFRVPRFHLNRNLNSTGTFNFNRGMTQGPDPLRATANGGFGAASLLLGAGASGNITHSDVFTLNRHYYGIYIQDNWKLTTRFTLNLGLRYNLEVGQNESHDRMAFMDLESLSPLAQRVGLPLRGVLRFAGRDGNTRNLVATDKNNLAPRFGFAYRLRDTTAIRAGYGIFYSAQWISAYDPNVYPSFNTNTDWVATVDGLVPEVPFSNPFPQGFSLPLRDRNSLTNVGSALSGWIQDERVGYAQQWSLSLQQQYGSSFLVEAAYWGNKGTKMENRSGWQENSLPNRYLALGAGLSQLVNNPFFGVIERGTLSGPRVAQRQLLLPFPQYTSLVRTGPSAGNSIYHAFTLRVEKRFTQDLSFLGSYTASKQIDDFDARPLDHENRRLERSVSAFDVPQRLVLSYIYELPVGRRKAFGASMHPVLDAVAGGWSISGITTFQSGMPVGVSRPSLNNGQSAKLDTPTIDRWFDTSVFRLAEPFTFGNVGRLLPDVRSHGVKDFDLAIGKSFHARERYELKFRTEFFNAFNTPRFGSPAGGVGTATFGTVSSQVNRPRSVQFGLQLYW